MNLIFKRVGFSILLVLQTLLLISCVGGGNSGSSMPTKPSNNTPTTPTVVMMKPANNSTEASLSQVIQLSFSESVANVTESTVTLHESNPTGIVVATSPLTPDSDGKSYTFSALSNLNKDTKYYVVIGNGIRSLTNNVEIESTNFNFTTVQYANPTVNMISPTNESTNVSTSQDIVLQFSESVSNVTNTTVVLHESSPTGIAISTSVTTGDNNQYVFHPTSLAGGTNYYVEVTNNITSVATGEPLTPAEFTFATSSTNISPTVVMLNPSNNGTTESLSPNITIQFSESVTNLTNNNIILHKGIESGSVVSTSIVKTLSNNTYILKPSESLMLGITYYLELKDEITSVSSGAHLIPVVFSFKVKSSGFAYITYMDGISVCMLNRINGGLENCTLNNLRKGAVGISADSVTNSIYLVNKESNSISTCHVSGRTGKISFCTDTNGFNTPVSIAVSKNGLYAYVLNYSGGKSVVGCAIAESGGLQNCRQTAYMPSVESGSTGAMMYFVNPTNITLDSDNKYAYIADAHDNTITTCAIDNSQDLTNCTFYKNSVLANLKALAVSTNGKYLYSENDSQVLDSFISQEDGTINSVSMLPYVYTNISDIISYNNKLYISDNGNGAITMCDEDTESANLKYCHFTQLGLYKATGIAILGK